MSTTVDDHLLLRQFVEESSEDAFSELVKRHIDHVYSVAVREVSERDLAADLTQAAFILLARKAGKIRAQESLSGWLFQTVRYAARNARRAAWRRQHHEQEAAAMNTVSTEPEPDATWEQLAPVLNDGLASLSSSDRDVLTLRFFEKQSHEAIAGRLGVPETAARKRLSRAIERLRRFFVRRGVRVGEASLVAVLAAQSVSAAPSGLAGAVAAAGVAKGAGASVSVAVLVKDGLSAMAWAKLKVAGLVGALAAVALGGFLFKFGGAPATRNESGWVLEELQFTNRFVDKAWGNSVSTTDGAAHLFVRSTKRTGVLEQAGRLFDGAGSSAPDPSPVILQVEDDRGDSVEGSFLLRHSANTREQSDLRELAFFPRRGSNLVLRLVDRLYNPIAEFRVPNPAFASYPELTPESLPATNHDGDFAVTLEEFDTGWSGGAVDAASTARRFPRRRTTLTFSLRQQERPAWPWTVNSLTLADGTGNQWQESRPAMLTLSGAEARFQVRPHLAVWSGEPAWHVEMELMRTNEFAPADVLTIPTVPVPATNQVVELNQDHRLNGHPVRVVSLSGPQAGSVSDKQRPPGHLVLRLDVRGTGTDWSPGLVEVRDDLERPWRVIDNTRSGNRVSFYLDGLVGTRALTLRLAWQEIRRVNFTARPGPAQAGSTSEAKDGK